MATIRDVAREAGLSTGTISKALKHPGKGLQQEPPKSGGCHQKTKLQTQYAGAKIPQ